jgi:uncharacterized membrane protein
MLRFALVVIGALPLVVWASSFTPLERVSDLIDPLFAFHCHRDPNRTIELFGRRLPVCARCTGIYAGFIVGALVRAPPTSRRFLSWAAVVTAALLVADVATESFGWRVPSIPVRFITGLGFSSSAVLAALMMPASARR